jgi:DNA-binding transcriptional LysR family regulator
MDLRKLRYFVMVANERGFTRAAKRLHIAQPPLSRQIQQLEAELGTQLIDRAARPFKLTPIGRLFYEQATQVLGRVDEMRSMMSRAVAAERRRFVIGFVASTIYARLPGLIREFRVEAPNVDLSLVEMGSLDQITALKEGIIDVGFGRIRFENNSVRRTVLREEKLVVAVAADHVLAQEKGAVSLTRLAAEALILYPNAPRPSYADQVLSIFQDYGLSPRSVREVRELQIAVGMVAAQEGICIVPESVRQLRSEDVRYLDLMESPTSPIILSYPAGGHSPELILLTQVIVKTYDAWGYIVPDAIREISVESHDRLAAIV